MAKKLPFVERQRFIRKVEAFIARGLDALDAGAPVPTEPLPEDEREWMPSGRWSDLGVIVDRERAARIAAARGMSEIEVYNAAFCLGQKKDD